MKDIKKGKQKRTVIDSSKPGGLMGHLAPECGCRKNKMLEYATIMIDCAQTQAQKNTYIHTRNKDTKTRDTEQTQHTRTHAHNLGWKLFGLFGALALRNKEVCHEHVFKCA